MSFMTPNVLIELLMRSTVDHWPLSVVYDCLCIPAFYSLYKRSSKHKEALLTPVLFNKSICYSQSLKSIGFKSLRHACLIALLYMLFVCRSGNI